MPRYGIGHIGAMSADLIGVHSLMPRSRMPSTQFNAECRTTEASTWRFTEKDELPYSRNQGKWMPETRATGAGPAANRTPGMRFVAIIREHDSVAAATQRFPEGAVAHRTLVLGGARSGKSEHAEGLLSVTDPVTYVATSRRDPSDAEWTERIATHVARRPSGWATVEASGDALCSTLAAAQGYDPPLLVDDLATWLTGVLDDAGAWERDANALHAVSEHRDALVNAVAACPARLVIVSAEVGLGVIPGTRSGRLFRDELGALNARLAEVCEEVVLLVAGIPLRLRPSTGAAG
jgi:adenosylcobinamide kinase/adenosylcobinamide-phosphate guanylyltransferase